MKKPEILEFYLKGPVFYPVFLILLAFFLSCQTVQKDLLFSTVDDGGAGIDITELERAIAGFDVSSPAREELAAVRRKINELEKKSVPDGAFGARLAAWSGRLYIFERKINDARRQLKLSESLSPGNPQAAILAIRLEEDLQKRLALVDGALEFEKNSGELWIERARVLLELKRFPETVAAFDAAFALLTGKFYEEIYRPSRDLAWEMRNISSETKDKTVEIAQSHGLNWLNLIDLTKSESDLLRFLTAGRDWKGEDIFSRLLERSFIPLTQDIAQNEWPRKNPQPGEIVLRSGAAWFLWRLYAENRSDKGLLVKYSSRYSNMRNPKSPIPDLPLLSPFFDAILGCVEVEFMSLEDGRNFVPDKAIGGAEFLAMIRKLTP
jgi:tetratricopeptide (TPR) repeat protein